MELCELLGGPAVTPGPGAATPATPVGFEPTRGDPIGLAGRRLSRSAKVSCGGRKEQHINDAGCSCCMNTEAFQATACGSKGQVEIDSCGI